MNTSSIGLMKDSLGDHIYPPKLLKIIRSSSKQDPPKDLSVGLVNVCLKKISESRTQEARLTVVHCGKSP